MTILQDRLGRLLSDDVHLRRGAGKGANGEIDMCLVQAADWLSGGSGAKDHPQCVSRNIADYCITLNDSPLFAKHRDMLKPYAAKIVGTGEPSGEREMKRAYMFVDYAVRVFAPIWLRTDPKHRFDDYAAKLEGLAPVTDEPTRKAARRAAYAAYAATSSASAAAAADAAHTADATYTADAADAAYTVTAATRTAVLASHGNELRHLALKCLDDVLAIPESH